MRRSILAAVFALIALPESFAQPPAPESEDSTQQIQPQPAPLPPPQAERIFTTPSEARMRLRSIFGPTRPGVVRERLVRAPAMFGDFYRVAPTLSADVNIFTNTLEGVTHFRTDLLAGDWSGLKVAENNSALPLDRVYFTYNHHHSALTTQTRLDPIAAPPEAFGRQYALDRYTLAMEKTLFSGESSIEVRIPFADGPDFRSAFQQPFFPPALSHSAASGAVFGNVSLLFKHLLYADQGVAISGGLGVELPTGGDAHARSGFNDYTLHNDAAHLHPFLAFLRNSDDDRLFLNGFAQVDFSTASNRLSTVDPYGFSSPPGVPFDIGNYTPQKLLHLSLGGGYWLYRNDDAPFASGLAGLVELHYLSTLQNSDMLQFGNPALLINQPFIVLNQRQNRFDVLNLTTGLHLQVDPHSILRVGVAVPLSSANNRLFDAELLVQFTRLL